MKTATQLNSTRLRRRAFTLVEMLLVLAILALLAGIALPKLTGQKEKANIKATQTQIAAFKTALDMFEVDNGHFPKKLQDLVVQPRDAQSWHQYMDNIPPDPWGNAYIYQYPGKHMANGFDLSSMGPDGRANTEDDIANWQLQNTKEPMRANKPCTTRAFTLIELILVMAVLIMLVSLVTPKLAQFFGNRDLDSEVRRFVALTHYGQNRAVSEGIPTLLWIDPKAGTYGLQLEVGYTDNDQKAEQFSLPEGLSIGVDTTRQPGSKALTAGKAVGIRFSPDGSVIADTSVKAVFIKRVNGAQVWIVQSPDRLSYEVKS